MTSSSNPLCRLLYRSRSAIAGSDEAIEAKVASILQGSAARNGSQAVTGVLLFSSSVFLQALEGPRDAVEAAFERVCRDAAHFELEIIEYAPVAERAFGNWSMRRLRADAPVEWLLLQLGQPENVVINGPDLASRAVTLMSTLVLLEQSAESAKHAA